MLDTKYNLEEFRKMAAELLKSLPTLKKVEQVTNGIKMLNLGYLNLEGSAADKALAVGVWHFVSRRAREREMDLQIGS